MENRALFETLAQLPSDILLYLDDGPLKHKLIENYLDEEDAVEEIMDFDLETTLQVIPGNEDSALIARLEKGDFLYLSIFSVGALTHEETEELMALLQPHRLAARLAQSRSQHTIVRKKAENGLIGQQETARKLGLSPRKLKILIPCTKVRILEHEGEKRIEGYFWHKNLVEHFTSLWNEAQQGIAYDAEDINAIATHCCDGDRGWACELIEEYLTLRRKDP